MLINVSTRKFKRSVRLPRAMCRRQRLWPVEISCLRHFVALSTTRLKEWMARDLSSLGLLVIQIDGIHMDDEMTLVAAVGVDANGDKHPLGWSRRHGKRSDRAGADR